MTRPLSSVLEELEHRVTATPAAVDAYIREILSQPITAGEAEALERVRVRLGLTSTRRIDNGN